MLNDTFGSLKSDGAKVARLYPFHSSKAKPNHQFHNPVAIFDIVPSFLQLFAFTTKPAH